MAFTTPTTLSTRRNALRAHGARRLVCATATASTETATSAPALSRRAIDLRGYLRCHKSLFQPGAGFLAQTAALTRKNDTTRTLIPADELAINASILPGFKAAEYVLEHHDRLVALGVDVAKISNATDSATEELADIVRYNVACVLRVMSYAAAVRSADFLNSNNAGMMRELHQEAGVDAALFANGVRAIADDIAMGVGADKETAAAVHAASKAVCDAVCS